MNPLQHEWFNDRFLGLFFCLFGLFLTNLVLLLAVIIAEKPGLSR